MSARWKTLPPGMKVHRAGGVRPVVKLPTPTHGEGQGMLALAKPKMRHFKAKVPTASERQVQRTTVEHLNRFMRDGGVFHIPNEQGLMGLFPDDDAGQNRARNYLVGLIADGMIPGITDLFGVRPFPARWRAILLAAGETLPEPAFMPGLCAAYEKKRPGWQPDKEWRQGHQPKAHAWLRQRGVPVDIGTDWQHAREFFEACGWDMRARIVARGSMPAPPKPTATGGKKKGTSRQKPAEKTKAARRGPAGGLQSKPKASKKAVATHVSKLRRGQQAR